MPRSVKRATIALLQSSDSGERVVPIQGQCDPRFSNVRDAFAQNFESGGDLGASFAATLNGELVVDLWGGWKDEAKTQPWERDTIVNVYSTTKTMAALCMLLLADRREVDLYAPVAKYWPEFRAAGKSKVELRTFMSHSAGLSGIEQPVTIEDCYDWEKITTLLARQEPWWEPGTQSGYHAITQGYLLGEVVRRVTGETLGTFFRRNIAEPLGADFHIGVADKHFPRIGNLIPPPDSDAPLAPPDPNSIAARTFRSPPVSAAASRTDAWRRAEIPAANGHGNARSVVIAQTPLANRGEAFGKRLLSEAGCKRIFDEQTNGQDLVLGMPVRFGMGYGLSSDMMPISPNPNTCFWGGWGGSLVVVDQDAHLCFAYVMNKMAGGTVGDARAGGPAMALYEALR